MSLLHRPQLPVQRKRLTEALRRMSFRTSFLRGLEWFFCGPRAPPDMDPTVDELYVAPVMPRVPRRRTGHRAVYVYVLSRVMVHTVNTGFDIADSNQ